MINTNFKASDLVTLLGVINPSSQAAGTATSGWIRADTHVSYLVTLLAGALGASATVDLKLQQATDSSGTGAKDITGSSITQLTKVGTDDNKQALINLRGDRLDINGGFTYFRASLTDAIAASLTVVLIQGIGAFNAPGTHATTVDEVVTV